MRISGRGQEDIRWDTYEDIR
jgi:hypothetical protein